MTDPTPLASILQKLGVPHGPDPSRAAEEQWARVFEPVLGKGADFGAVRTR